MTTQEYIESGVLELYVYGQLNAEEMNSVLEMSQKHSEIKREIELIEQAVVHLSSSIAPRLSGRNYEQIKSEIFGNTKVIDIKPTSRAPLFIGWAAAMIFLAGFVYQFMDSQSMIRNLEDVQADNELLENQIVNLESQVKDSESLLSLIRDKNNKLIPLGGQEVAPQAFAKIIWNQENQTVYVDAIGLPEPPEGMVYQIWSLKLNPLTPTSIGLLDDFIANKDKVFKVDATTGAEAFGITLEPAGGSPSPTMEQLYTLGVVS
jgi:hypothetical protein